MDILSFSLGICVAVLILISYFAVSGYFKVNRIEKITDMLEMQIEKESEELYRKIDSHVENIYNRIEKLNEELTSNDSRIEHMLETTETELYQKIDDNYAMENRLLDSRIDKIENKFKKQLINE